MTVLIGPPSTWSVLAFAVWLFVLGFFWLLFVAHGRNQRSKS